MASFWWRAYVPGVVSATTGAPSAIGTLRLAHRAGLCGRSLVGAVTVGTPLLDLAAIGSLYLDMPRLGDQPPTQASTTR